MITAEDMVMEKKHEIITVSPDTTIYEAIKLMNKNNIGSIFIKENDDIVGVWTERDLLRNSGTKNFNLKTAIIRDYMTKNLISVKNTHTIYQLIDIFLGRRLRRLLVEKDGEYIGLLSVGDVMKSCLVEKDKELKSLNEIVSWEYYENWRWTPKK